MIDRVARMASAVQGAFLMSFAASQTTDLTLATERARLLVGCYRKDDAGDPEVFARAVVAVLMRYPPDVVGQVTEPATGLPSRLKWLPSIAEIVEACDVAMAPILRRRERERLEEERRRALPGPTQPKPTKEELAAKYPWLFPNKDAPPGQRARGFRPLAEIAAEAGLTQEQIDALPNAPGRSKK
jgi:hypothetical protein